MVTQATGDFQDRCPNCGYCPNCGRKNAAPLIPYPYFVPYYQPAFPPMYPWPITISGASRGGVTITAFSGGTQ
jgi:hypothetical protein